MSLIQSIGTSLLYGHVTTKPASEGEVQHPLPTAGRHRVDPKRNDQIRVAVPVRPKEQR